MMLKFVRCVVALSAPLAAAALFAQPAQAAVFAELVSNKVESSDPNVNDLSDQTINVNAPSGDFNGVSIDALSHFGPGDILFKNGIAATGGGFIRVTTGVAVTFTNDESFAVHPILNSTLLAAGIGVFRTADMNSVGAINNTASSCTAAQLKNCGSPDAALAQQVDFFAPIEASGGYTAGFAFNVAVDGNSVYDLSGEMGVLDHNPQGFYETFNGADTILNGFTETSNPGDAFARSYTWQDTPVDIDLGVWLQPGESVTAIYTVTTYATITNASQLITNLGGENKILTPIAFSSFGDPVGRGGVITQSLARGFMAMDALSDPSISNIDTGAVAHFGLPTGYVDPVTHDFVARLPGFTVFSADVGAVPEPASWALMIAGFGILGSAVRRRRSVAAAA